MNRLKKFAHWQRDKKITKPILRGLSKKTKSKRDPGSCCKPGCSGCLV